MDIYQALANPVRREILALLREGPKSAGELSDAFDLSKPTLSGHFSVLKEAGLIAAERDGAKIIYHLNLSVVEEALSGLMDIFRIGQPSGKPEREAP